jgi:hypothetical protein
MSKRRRPESAIAGLARESLPASHHIDLELRVGGRHVRGWQSEFTAHDIATLCQSARLVKCDLAIAALSSKAAVARDD